MELRDYIRVYWQQRWLILGLTVVATVTAVIVSLGQPTRSGVSESFAINRVNKESTPDYQYDGYYALQAADLFAQTVVSWFSTPSVLKDMYDQAKLDPGIESLNSLAARFKVKKYSAQNIVVRFSESTPARAATLAAAIKTVMEDRAASLNQSSDGKAIFSIVGSQPVIAPVKSPTLLIAVATAMLSFGFGLLWAAARHYLR